MLGTVRPPRCPARMMQRSPPCFCLPCVALWMGVASPRDMISALDPVQRMSAETPFVGPVISLLCHQQTKGQHRSSRKVTMVPAKKDNVIAVYAATCSNARPCPIGKWGVNFAAGSPRWLRPICRWDRNKSSHPITDKSSGYSRQTVKRPCVRPTQATKLLKAKMTWHEGVPINSSSATRLSSLLFPLAPGLSAQSFPPPSRNVAPRLYGL
jgi:hypothetical protein